MTTTGPITPYVSWDEIRAVYDRLGGLALYRRLPDPERHLRGTDALRWTADQIRLLTDSDLPDRPRLIADAMDGLAAHHESRPISGDDVLNVAGEDVALFDLWADRCRDRSEMLEPLQSVFGWLTDRDPRVEAARIAFGHLPDADLLLPGIDAALRPVLARYVGDVVGETVEPGPAPTEAPRVDTEPADPVAPASRATLLRLIRDLLDSDDCWYDHHGGCQAHGYLSLEPGEQCPHAEAKDVLVVEEAAR